MTDTMVERATATGTELEVDVLIVGAGISGIDAAWHLRHRLPDRSFLLVDALEDFGGTWRTHRYPGVRSDSDLYTFGFGFKPWTGPPIATAEEILTYLGEVIDEEQLAPHIRYRHQVERANWDHATARWTVEITDVAKEQTLTVVTPFLWMCQGYYRHDEGYTPDWPGFERYQGRVVHPQTWPEDLDLTNQEVLVIGSGATAATLVPAIAGDCAHLTMLQRSPTYFWTGENRNELADQLRELEVDETWIHEIVRRRVLKDQQAVTQLCLEDPEFAKEALIESIRPFLPEGYDVATHFTPRYRPWQQRIAFVPDGDLFVGIAQGKASVVTDEIDHFTERGLVTKSGQVLEADVIITATGFHLAILGDIDFSIDGAPLDLSTTVTWRGVMFTGVPNLAWIFGYFRASWTLRADLVCDLVCRILAHAEELGARSIVPQLRPSDADMEVGSWMDPENFNPSYLMRSMDRLPLRGDRPEWQHSQDYWTERETLPEVDLDDGCLRYLP